MPFRSTDGRSACRSEPPFDRAGHLEREARDVAAARARGQSGAARDRLRPARDLRLGQRPRARPDDYVARALESVARKQALVFAICSGQDVAGCTRFFDLQRWEWPHGQDPRPGQDVRHRTAGREARRRPALGPSGGGRQAAQHRLLRRHRRRVAASRSRPPGAPVGATPRRTGRAWRAADRPGCRSPCPARACGSSRAGSRDSRTLQPRARPKCATAGSGRARRSR